jgi:SAM-dependent methyltransferase
LLTQAPFDLAICHNTLDHTDQPAVWFNDLFARLRDGGRFIFQVNLSREDLPQSAEHRAMHPSALTIDQVMGWLQMKSSSFDYFCESKANSDNEFYFLSWGTKTADEPVIYHPVTIPIRVQTPATMDSNASPPPREAVPLEAAPLKIAEPATQVDVGPRPLTTRFVPPWLGGITIKGGTEPFVNLPTIAELAGVAALQKQALREFGLNEPLSGYRSRDTGPLPAVADREHYFGPNHTGYWLSGLSDTLSVADHAKRLGLGPQVQYFELGCASGRVVRHVAFQTDAQIWCCDLNKRHTEWVRQFLPERIKVFHNSAIPNLPLPDNSVDVASAFSVFTHIDDFETAWLLELHRILRPGGLAYLTISSEYTWEQYKQNWIKDQLLPLSENITEYSISEKFFEGSLPREKTVIWWPAGQDVYNATVFHETSYIRKEWGRLFTVIDIIRNGHAYQDVVLLTK